MISTALATFEQRVGALMLAMQADQVSRQQATAGLSTLADGTRQKFENQKTRIEQLIVGTDSTFDQHKAALLEIIDNLQKSVGREDLAGARGDRVAEREQHGPAERSRQVCRGTQGPNGVDEQWQCSPSLGSHGRGF